MITYGKRQNIGRVGTLDRMLSVLELLLNIALENLESVISQADDTNFEGYSGSTSNDGDDNSENDADDIDNPTFDSASGYIDPSGLDWSLEPSAKSNIQPQQDYSASAMTGNTKRSSLRRIFSIK
ncbi:hypothetical protein FQA39_LY02275 [Lamprigera yunnana]|nr:hypothetical protein FQA39_LY02275 [Lamprigera yunnana]